VDQATHNKIVSFIWGIADDVLRDLFKRGKYPDVILPMCVIRRMDAVLEPTKQAVLDTKKMLDEAGITEQRAALAEAAGQVFYNTSKFTLRDLKSRGSQQQLLADFEDCPVIFIISTELHSSQRKRNAGPTASLQICGAFVLNTLG
jgi:type I restriction enzyme M protein